MFLQCNSSFQINYLRSFSGVAEENLAAPRQAEKEGAAAFLWLHEMQTACSITWHGLCWGGSILGWNVLGKRRQLRQIDRGWHDVLSCYSLVPRIIG